MLLIEAGGSDELDAVFDTDRWVMGLGSELDWGFVAEPNPNLNGRALLYSMGKVLGGVAFDGRDITHVATPQIVRAGIASVPEARRLFAAMTVRENLLMGAYSRNGAAVVSQDLVRVLALFPRLQARLAQRGETLSGGEQQKMVAMARAMMARPRLSCMDEPTMGLSPLYVDRVLDLIRTINGEGITIFMDQRNATLALRIAHYGYVLQTGRIVLQGRADELIRDPRIRDAYLGGGMEAAA